jgi:hypothetical protein
MDETRKIVELPQRGVLCYKSDLQNLRFEIGEAQSSQKGLIIVKLPVDWKLENGQLFDEKDRLRASTHFTRGESLLSWKRAYRITERVKRGAYADEEFDYLMTIGIVGPDISGYEPEEVKIVYSNRCRDLSPAQQRARKWLDNNRREWQLPFSYWN